jgi:hypothetical protein
MSTCTSEARSLTRAAPRENRAKGPERANWVSEGAIRGACEHVFV